MAAPLLEKVYRSRPASEAADTLPKPLASYNRWRVLDARTDGPDMHLDLPLRHRATPRRHRRPATLAAATLLTAGLLAGTVLAACSTGPGQPGVASAGTTTTTSATGASSRSGTGALAFAHCMQTHGVPDFPDPGATGRTVIKGGPTSDLSPTSPAFKKAQRDCRKYSTQGHMTPAQEAQARADALKFSQCMRKHGVPDFPDPTFTGTGGGIRISIHSSPGSTPNLNPNAPTFQAAQKACQKYTPGRGKGLKTSHGPAGSNGSGSSTGGAATTATGSTT